MKVAQYPGTRGRYDVVQRGAPKAEKILAQRGWRRSNATMRQIPIEHELDLDQEGFEIVGRKFMLDAGCHGQRRGQIRIVQSDENVDRGGIALLDWRRRIARGDAFGAEILDQEKAGLEIGRENFRRAETALAQASR